MNRKPQAKSQAAILVREMRAAGIPFQRQQALEMVAKMHGFRDWNSMVSAPEAPVVPAPVVTPPPALEDIRILGWSVNDVQTVCPYLSDDEALMLLMEVERKYDASIGINYDTFPIVASYFFKDRILNGTLLYEVNGENQTARVTVNLSDDGKVFVDGRALSEFIESADGVLVIDELPNFNGFPVVDGCLFSEEEEEDRMDAMWGLIADLDKAGALTSIRND